MRRTALATAFCLAAACGTEQASLPSAPSPGMTPTGGGVSSLIPCVAKDAGDVDTKMVPVFDCGVKVWVHSMVPEFNDEVASAVNIWNGVLGQNGLPVLATSGPAPKKLIVKWTGTGDFLCGNALRGQDTIRITRSTSSTTCAGEGSTNAVTITRHVQLLAHELSHSIGFGHLSQLGSVPAVNHCVASLPAGGGLNGGLCLAEIINLQHQYGMRTDINRSKPILTSMGVAGPNNVNVGSTVTLNVDELIFDGATAPPNPTGVTFRWTSADPTKATVSGGTSPSNVIMGVDDGATQIRVQMTDTRYQTANPGDQAVFPFTVNPPPSPPPAPTNLTASEISFTSARVSWTNGTTGATTTVQYRVNGTTPWTTFSTVGTGIATDTITGLTGNTPYDVRIYHTKSGLEGAKLVRNNLFRTLNPSVLPPITNFIVLSCRQQVTGGKTYNFFTMGWTSAPSPPGSSFQIASNSTNNSGGATIMITVPGSQRQAEVGSWQSSPTLLNRWFWVRYVGGPWVALNPSPLAANQCLL